MGFERLGFTSGWYWMVIAFISGYTCIVWGSWFWNLKFQGFGVRVKVEGFQTSGSLGFWSLRSETEGLGFSVLG